MSSLAKLSREPLVLAPSTHVCSLGLASTAIAPTRPLGFDGVFPVGLALAVSQQPLASSLRCPGVAVHTLLHSPTAGAARRPASAPPLPPAAVSRCVHTSRGQTSQSSGHTPECNHSVPPPYAPAATALHGSRRELPPPPFVQSSGSNSWGAAGPYSSPVLAWH